MTRGCTTQDLLDLLEEMASFGLAEAWDNVGLMVGGRSREVSGILVALDPTEGVLSEAIDSGLNVIITHHPLIFNPLKTVDTGQPAGRFLEKALGHSISVIGCHTNLDQAPGGVNDSLAGLLGLEETRPLTMNSQDPGSVGFGRLGCFAAPLTGSDFLKHLAAVLGLSGLEVAGRLPETVERVAVCGGSGSDLAETARLMGAQVYVTAEVKHATARWAEACGFCVVDGTHFATENPVVPVLANHLRRALTERGIELEVRETAAQRSPFVFYQADGTPL